MYHHFVEKGLPNRLTAAALSTTWSASGDYTLTFSPHSDDLTPGSGNHWTAGATSGEFYYNTAITPRPVRVVLNGETAVHGTVGSLAAGQWGYDSANSRVYFRLSDGSDPDTLASGSIMAVDPDWFPTTAGYVVVKIINMADADLGSTYLCACIAKPQGVTTIDTADRKNDFHSSTFAFVRLNNTSRQITVYLDAVATAGPFLRLYVVGYGDVDSMGLWNGSAHVDPPVSITGTSNSTYQSKNLETYIPHVGGVNAFTPSLAWFRTRLKGTSYQAGLRKTTDYQTAADFFGKANTGVGFAAPVNATPSVDLYYASTTCIYCLYGFLSNAEWATEEPWTDVSLASTDDAWFFTIETGKAGAVAALIYVYNPDSVTRRVGARSQGATDLQQTHGELEAAYGNMYVIGLDALGRGQLYISPKTSAEVQFKLAGWALNTATGGIVVTADYYRRRRQ